MVVLFCCKGGLAATDEAKQGFCFALCKDIISETLHLYLELLKSGLQGSGKVQPSFATHSQSTAAKSKQKM